MSYRLLSSTALSRPARTVCNSRAFASQAASLIEYLPGVPESTWNGTGVERKAQVTTLSNGLRVASVSTNYPATSLGLFINTGTRHETRHEAGSVQALKHLAFQSSQERMGIEVVREIEVSGSTLNATASREHLLFSSETTRDNAKTVLSVLKGIMQPSLPYHEVTFQYPTVEADVDRAQSCDVTNLFELVHQQAYRHKGLGQSLIAPKENIHHITNETLASFVKTHYTPSNAVVVGFGFEHNELVENVKAEFESLSGSEGASKKSTQSKYFGGEVFVNKHGNTHAAVAFEGLGANANAKDLLALGVLQHVLGRGLQGPNIAHTSGKASVLSTKVLANNAGVQSVSSFNFTYSDSGLFGVYVEASENVAAALESVKKELASLKDGKLDEKEITRGKNALKAALLETGDRRLSALEAIGAQVLATGKVHTPEEIAKQVDEITAADVSKVAQKVFSSKPTLCAIGDVADLPTF